MIAPLSSSRRSCQGFTLVEMAIVIAIIGLLIGAIMSGQYMIKQSELQSVMADMNKYKASVLQFRQQYGGLPGDLTDAQDYWGADTCPSTDTSAKIVTCNGDGDGQIHLVNDTNEIWRAWQHLSNAGYISGTFSGAVGSAGGYDSVPGQNVPAGRRTGTGYSIFYIPTIDGANAATYPNFYQGDYGTLIEFGAQSSGNVTNGPALTSREALRLDTKYDDGMPALGKIFVNLTSSIAACAGTQASNVTTANYTPSTSGLVSCSLNFIIDR